MTDRQEVKFNMYDTTDVVLTEHNAIVSAIPLLDEAHRQLQNNMDDIEETSGRKEASGSGVAAEKKVVKVKLAASSMRLVGLLKSEASRTGNNELAGKLKYSQHVLERTRDGRLPSVADTISGLAQTQVAALKRAGLTDEQLADHQALTSRFRELSPLPKKGRADKSVEVEKLEALFAATDKLLREQIDPMVRNQEEKHPDFVKRYFAARKIDDNASAAKQPAEQAPAQLGA